MDIIYFLSTFLSEQYPAYFMPDTISIEDVSEFHHRLTDCTKKHRCRVATYSYNLW